MMVVAEFFYCGLIFFLNVFYEEEKRQRERGERRGKERNRW